MTETDALLRRYAAAMDARDWPGLRALLDDDFEARFVHTGETFGPDDYVAFQDDYPGAWRYLVDDLVADGRRGVLRARVTDGEATFHVAVFATVGVDLVTEAVEVWTEAERARGERAHAHHGLDYVEISVADLDRARAFYGEAFGWRFNDYGPEYAGIVAPDGAGEVGGLGVGREPGESGADGVLVLLYSDDLDATVAAVEAAGGTVVEAPYAFPGGRRFFFSDPDGNRLGAWAAA